MAKVGSVVINLPCEKIDAHVAVGVAGEAISAYRENFGSPLDEHSLKQMFEAIFLAGVEYGRLGMRRADHGG